MNGATCQGGASKVISCEQRRRVLRIREGQVHKDALQDDEYADREYRNTDDRADPMH
jgi:hypothetical protein